MTRKIRRFSEFGRERMKRTWRPFLRAEAARKRAAADEVESESGESEELQEQEVQGSDVDSAAPGLFDCSSAGTANSAGIDDSISIDHCDGQNFTASKQSDSQQ